MTSVSASILNLKVLGHLYNYKFPEDYSNWNKTDIKTLFDGKFTKLKY